MEPARQFAATSLTILLDCFACLDGFDAVWPTLQLHHGRLEHVATLDSLAIRADSWRPMDPAVGCHTIIAPPKYDGAA